MKIGENSAKYKATGTIVYIRNRRARNLTIRITRRGEVRVTIPGAMSRKRAEGFVERKRPWIHRKLAEIRERSSPLSNLKEGDPVVVRGKAIPLRLSSSKESPEDALWRILLQEAKAFLPSRVDELARSHGFTYTGVRIRKMVSRWGSCSAKGMINLNSWLVLLPDHLTDYVILHELVHTLHRNHGPHFWETLDRHTGGRARELQKELRSSGIGSVDTV